MAKTVYPYYVPAINWNGRMVKIDNKKKTIDAAYESIKWAIDEYPKNVSNGWTRGALENINATNQLFIMKYSLNEDDEYRGGYTTIVRIYDKNGNLVYNIE